MENKITLSLIIASVAVFLLIFSAPQSTLQLVFNSFSFSSGTMPEFWRILTSLFLHANATHLFFNMLGIFFFGRIVEKEVPAAWFISIYFISGIAGNLAFAFTNPGPLVGASGALFGLMGAAMLMNPVGKIHIYVIPLPVGLVALLFVIAETLIVYSGTGVPNVAHVAHLGGLAAGSLFAFAYDPRRSLTAILFLIVLGAALLILGPVFQVIIEIAGMFIGLVDSAVGFMLYGLADVLSFAWG